MEFVPRIILILRKLIVLSIDHIKVNKSFKFNMLTILDISESVAFLTSALYLPQS